MVGDTGLEPNHQHEHPPDTSATNVAQVANYEQVKDGEGVQSATPREHPEDIFDGSPWYAFGAPDGDVRLHSSELPEGKQAS